MLGLLNYQINQDMLGNIYIINTPTSKLVSTTINGDATLWHKHLGHSSTSMVKDVMLTCNKP